ncbi:similarity to yeast mcm2 protein (nucleomorph) [Guillardia theta]|uniref:Similarity to yeast mcm2 protein n=1 Tax=Guillardia theta TaxID=55529 RepID=Q98S13_GUITH|nr:similarity to yeast mcm2 protein [Guillardia theta]AAK39765.1 similarity to yeast mcm2 protein [Guillardia theta]
MNTEHKLLIDKIIKFFFNIMDEKKSNFLYIKKLVDFSENNDKNFVISFIHISLTDPILGILLIDYPDFILLLFKKIICKFCKLFTNKIVNSWNFTVTLSNYVYFVKIEKIFKQKINCLIGIEGTIIFKSHFRKKKVFQSIICKNCLEKKIIIKNQLKENIKVLKDCKTCRSDNIINISMYTRYEDYVLLKLQETKKGVIDVNIPNKIYVLFKDKNLNLFNVGDIVQVVGINRVGSLPCIKNKTQRSFIKIFLEGLTIQNKTIEISSRMNVNHYFKIRYMIDKHLLLLYFLKSSDNFFKGTLGFKLSLLSCSLSLNQNCYVDIEKQSKFYANYFFLYDNCKKCIYDTFKFFRMILFKSNFINLCINPNKNFDFKIYESKNNLNSISLGKQLVNYVSFIEVDGEIDVISLYLNFYTKLKNFLTKYSQNKEKITFGHTFIIILKPNYSCKNFSDFYDKIIFQNDLFDLFDFGIIKEKCNCFYQNKYHKINNFSKTFNQKKIIDKSFVLNYINYIRNLKDPAYNFNDFDPIIKFYIKIKNENFLTSKCKITFRMVEIILMISKILSKFCFKKIISKKEFSYALLIYIRYLLYFCNNTIKKIFLKKYYKVIEILKFLSNCTTELFN